MGIEAGAAATCRLRRRRTVVTDMSELGTLPHVVEAVVYQAGVAGVYNKAKYNPEKHGTP